jgi:hypothetical protein
LEVVHALPHEAQLDVVPSCVSHPFDSTPSQFAQPELHAIEHMPPVHEGVSWLVEQALPQPPQLSGSVPVLVSQLVPVEAQCA